MKFDFTLTGIDAIDRALRAAGDRAREAAAGALYREAAAIIAEAQELAPVDFGVLKSSDSAFVNPPDVDGDEISVELGFGGAAAAYALVQHETHKTKSKYLERPFQEAQSGMASRLAAEIRSKVER